MESKDFNLKCEQIDNMGEVELKSYIVALKSDINESFNNGMNLGSEILLTILMNRAKDRLTKFHRESLRN